MLGFNQVQNLLLCRRLRLHHPERCCQECEGLTASSVFFPTWPVVPLLFVGCLLAMHSLLCAAACLSRSSGGKSLGRNLSTGAGATCGFVTLTDWANPALRLRVPRSVNAHMLPLHLILGFHVLFSHVCGGHREFRNPSISARSDRLSQLVRNALLQNSVWGKRKGHSNDVVASRISVLC